jgi:hypothetical protein
MTDELKAKFIAGYNTDNHYAGVMKALHEHEEKHKTGFRHFPFAIQDGLLYHTPKHGPVRLCIP